jgi:hypothetical protein
LNQESPTSDLILEIPKPDADRETQSKESPRDPEATENESIQNTVRQDEELKTSTDDCQPLQLEGYLHKQGSGLRKVRIHFVFRKHLLFVKTWNKRWFVLDAEEKRILYYTNEGISSSPCECIHNILNREETTP